jgi:hypothetical protein
LGVARQRFYVIGSSREKRSFRVLKIDRSEPSELHLSEDPVWYSQQEVKSLLQRIAEGNRSTGGLTFVTKAYGIAGEPLLPNPSHPPRCSFVHSHCVKIEFHC